MSKWLVSIIILLLLGAAGYWFTSIPGTAEPRGQASVARFQVGPFTVLNEELVVVDETRSLPAYNDFAGADARTLNGEMWRPAGATKPGPLVIYSHGFMSFREEGLYLSQFLASHGYTVVAVDYPLTGYHAPDGPLLTDVVNQPGDISATLDYVLARNADPSDVLYQRIDPDQIAVAGVSLGGLTSLLAGFHVSLLDARIDAVVSIASPGSLFTGEFFARTDLPLLLVYGSEDAIVPYADNALWLQQLYPNADLVTLKGASHAGFAQPAATIMRFIDNPDGVGCRAVTSSLGALFTEDNEALFAQLGDMEEGIDMNREMTYCDKALPEKAMPAARQHMFTTLAVHAFLESLFGSSAAGRAEARLYLLETLPAENSREVAVSAGGSSQLQQ
jgi:predicted dienelactone hydrolase